MHTACKGQVTAMTTTGDFLYVGTSGGVLLALNSSRMEPQFVFHAYVGTVHNLLLVSPKQLPRHMWTKVISRSNVVISSISNVNSDDATQSANQQQPLRNRSNTDCMINQTSLRSLEHSVLVSFGIGYRGVVGDSENCPQVFTLPSDGKKKKPSKPSAEDSHLLLWSVEHSCEYIAAVPKSTAAGNSQVDDTIEENQV